MNNTAKRSLKDRVKHYTPEIIVGASVVAGLGSLFYIRKAFKPSMVSALAERASDSSIMVTGDEEVFIAMTADALATLEKFGKLDISDKDAVRYVLSLVTDK